MAAPPPLDEERIRTEAVVERTLTGTHRRLRFTVPKSHGPPHERPWRLDRYLHALLPTISRTLIQRWTDGGAALVDGKPAPAQTRLRPGAVVELTAPLPAPAEDAPPPPPLQVLYRDADLLIVAKAPGQLAHQAGRTMTGTLVNQIQDLLDAEGVTARARLINRIDRDTSGIVLVSLDEAAHAAVARAIEARAVHKEYLAIVAGVPDPPAGDWREPLGPAGDGSIRRSVRADGQPSHTGYALVEAAPQGRYALLRLTLHTGRQHQIRVHAAHHGLPLVGDWVYGTACRELPGQALHSARVVLPHPRTGAPLTVEAPLPAPLAALWAQLRAGGAPTAVALTASQRSRLMLVEARGVRRPSWLSAEEFAALEQEQGGSPARRPPGVEAGGAADDGLAEADAAADADDG